MKIQIVILATILAFLLLAPVALAQTGEPGPAPAYTVQAGTTGGGGYQLSSSSWHVSGTASGGSYSLAAADRAAGGNQCCCTFLPIVIRN
ncbi:MAG: hypothetical protein KKA73_18500 [Chloroflexi bacterium]|nr:hypothetical protein [Chloroflexota bacterium]MBU1749679.1 hypothetical protein [Chloroflexota bacterium]